MKKIGSLILLIFLLLVGTSWSQESSGSLEGRIFDSRQKAIASADISVKSDSLQGMRKINTDGKGYFRIFSLPVGKYTVKIQHRAFQSVTYENVTVRLGTTTSLGEIRLNQKTAEIYEITVTAEKPIVDPVANSLGANLGMETFATLPVERNFRSMLSLSPQVNHSFYGDEVNIAGSTGLGNVYFIDGINVTDPVNARTSTDLPYNFIKEIEVKTGGYEAEYGRALGGIVNVITYSGSNEIKGKLFGFFTNQNLAGTYRPGKVKQKIDSFSTYDFGLSLGGPLIRDNLWFYLAYNPTFEDREVEIPGLGLHQDRRRSHLFAGKLTWQASPKTNIVFTALGDPNTHKRISQAFSDALTVPNALTNPDPYLGEISSGGYNLSLHIQHVLKENILLKTAFSQSRNSDNDGPATQRGSQEPFFFDFPSGTLSGGYGRLLKTYTYRSAAHIQATFFWGDHTLKTGIAFEDNAVDGRAENLAGQEGQIPSIIFHMGHSQYWAVSSKKKASVHNRVFSIFAQDSWLVNNRLRINAGLRWDGQFFIGSDGKIAQRITDQWQPRFGFNYILGSPGTQKIFGSFGRFYEQIPLALAWAFYASSIYHEIYYFHDPRINPSGGFIIDRSHNILPEVKNLKGQHFDEFTFGYEKRIGNDFKVGIRGIHRKLRQAVDDGVDPVSFEYIIGNPGTGNLSLLPKFRKKYTGLEITLEKPLGDINFFFSYVLSKNHGNYTGLLDTDVGWAQANITSRDFPAQWINSTGLLPNDRTHVFKFYGTYHLPLGLSLGAACILQSGTPINEYGTFNVPGSVIFLRKRGTGGRTPTLWDTNIRLIYDLRHLMKTSFRPKLIADVFHLFSQREAVILDQLHYLAADAQGNQIQANPNYLVPSLYQPPMIIRLGFEIDF